MKKSVLRLISGLLCLLLLGALAACGGEDGEESSQGSETASTASGTSGEDNSCQVIKPKYDTGNTIVATVNVTDCGADPTGEKDSTTAIRTALNTAALKGGGTVWMPEGKYRLTAPINIPASVTLRGEWQDPDSADFDGNYGTVILADVAAKDDEISGFISIGANAGVYGMTVYYPNQSIDDVKPYPYTFYCRDIAPMTMRNITLINSYRGVGTPCDKAHALMMVETMRGTCLLTGIADYDAGDVGILNEVTFSAKYWANAGQGLRTADAAKITAWSKKHKAAALRICGSEQNHYANLNFAGYEYGIVFESRDVRNYASGVMYNVNISDCTYGVLAEEGYKDRLTNGEVSSAGNAVSLDYNMGICFAGGSISGSKYSVNNSASPLYQRNGCLKVNGVKLSGPTKGNVDSKNAKNDLSAYKMEAFRPYRSTGSFFKALSKNDTEETIQKALDEAGKAGGGTVYLPGGKYTIKGALTVPANVELKGCNDSASRTAINGTVLVIETPGVAEEGKTRTADAAVTLAGDNAGMSGIFLLYSENMQQINKDGSFKFYPYSVRGKGKGVYCVNCEVCGSNYGVDFTGCDDHYIFHLSSSCTEVAMTLGGKNGLVYGCMDHATLISWQGYLNCPLENSIFYLNIGRIRNQMFRVVESDGQKLFCNFTFGDRDFSEFENAKNALIINGGADTLAKHDTPAGPGYMHVVHGGSLTVINSLHIWGEVLKNDGGAVKIYNRMGRIDDGTPDKDCGDVK